MKAQEKSKILKRILAHFEKIAPGIVQESVNSLGQDKPSLDLYDIDFYMSKMVGSAVFDDIDSGTLREVTEEHIDQIDAIFFTHFKGAKLGG